MNNGICIDKRVFHDCFPGWMIRSYTDSDDFSWLWESGTTGQVSVWLHEKGQAPFCANLLILWDGMPEAQGTDRLLLDFVTPLDWALLYSQSLLARRDPPPLRIAILDFHSHHRPDAPAATLMPAILQAMPWVKIWRMMPGQDNFSPDISQLAAVLSKPDWAPLSETLIEVRAKLPTLLGAWQGALMQGQDHHAVSNKLGPWLLVDRYQTSNFLTSCKDRPVLNAILGHCRWLVDSIQESFGNHLNATVADIVPREVDLLLIDDQVTDGWDRVISLVANIPVGNFLAGPYQQPTEIGMGEMQRLVVSDSPIFLLGPLRQAEFELRNYGVVFSPAREGKKKFRDEIILIDLRLFSFKPPKAEADFLQSLIKIIEDKNLRDDNKLLAWPGFSIDEIDQMKAWLNKPTRTGQIYWTVLTALPRLIALASPSTPILLFSATGRRDIVEKLLDYGNIITSLEKPRFNTDGMEAAVSRFGERWKEAMQRAGALVEGRKRMRKIIQHKPAGSQGTIKGNNTYYVEVFFDETYCDDHTALQVGGCFAVFSDSALGPAIGIADRFNEILYEKGVRYFDPLTENAPPTNILKKKQSCAVQLTNALIEAKNEAPSLGAFRIKVKLGHDRDPTVSSETDSALRKALATCVELLVFETLPPVLGLQPHEETLNFSFYAATRVNSVQVINQSGTWPLHNSTRYRTGCRGFPDQKDRSKYLLNTINRDSMFPIINEISRRRGRIHIDRAVATTLVYEKNYSPDKPVPRKPVYFYCENCGNTIEASGKIKDAWHKFIRSHNLGESPTAPINTEICDCKAKYIADLRVLHYLADEILDKFPPKKIYSDNVKIEDKGGFDDVLDCGLEAMLDASQLLQVGDGVMACIKASGVIGEKDPEESTARHAILRRLAEVAEKFQGADILRFCDGIALSKASLRKCEDAATITPQSLVLDADQSFTETQGERQGTVAQRVAQDVGASQIPIGAIEEVWVQKVERDGFWITFSARNVGQTNLERYPASGWCPLQDQDCPQVGERIKIVFASEQGYRDGYSFVHWVRNRKASEICQSAA